MIRNGRLVEQLFSVTSIWQEEIVPRQWREGLIVNIFKKGDREDPANYRGITLFSVVGKVFCKILNNRLVQCLDKGGALHEGQAGFRTNRSCMDNVYTLTLYTRLCLKLLCRFVPISVTFGTILERFVYLC